MRTYLAILCYLKLAVLVRTGRNWNSSGKSLEEMIHETCLERSGYRKVMEDTFLRVVEVVANAEVQLPCSFCGESAEDSPRIWLWRRRLVNAAEEELELGLRPKLKDNRLYTLPDHTLTIRNISANDAGLYICRSLLEEEKMVFQFSVDLVQDEVPLIEESQQMSWGLYDNTTILQANKALYESSWTELARLLDKIKLRVTSEWDPWLPCNGCTGTRHRYAKCRLRSRLNIVKYPNMKEENLEDDRQRILHRSAVISCHSLALVEWYPYLYAITRIIPNFHQSHSCYGDCLKEIRMLYEPRYFLNLKLDTGTSISFVCPNSDLRTKIVWRKDGEKMKTMGAQIAFGKKKKKKKKKKLKHAYVDRMQILQLADVTKDETGVYVCYVDDAPIKGFNVTVQVSNESLEMRYYHFWLLSLYTCAISSTIVVTGIVFALVRRDLFVRLPTVD